MKKRKKKVQDIKIYGFPFPQELLEDLRAYKAKHNISIPASAYAALICVLKQIHREKTAGGELQEFNLSKYSKELGINYSSLYTGFQFLNIHGFVYESINAAGKPVYVLHNYDIYHGQKTDSYNYFIIPHSLFKTNIMAELIRTSNAKTFELFFSLLTQFRHGVARISKLGQAEEITYTRNMSTLKLLLGKRSKGVREALALLEPLFNISYSGIAYRGNQLWVNKVVFSLKPNTVIENNDAFEVHPLIQEFSKHTESTLNDLHISYKPRDLFDIMLSFKHEVIELLKYVSKDEQMNTSFSERDSYIQSYFYMCLSWFQQHIRKLRSDRKTFHFSQSIGAYFRTVFRNHILEFINSNIPYDRLHEAHYKEYQETGKIPVLYQKLRNS
ncbi:hypothetical protein ACWE42_23055 [Sutcliffiella cohnii]